MIGIGLMYEVDRKWYFKRGLSPNNTVIKVDRYGIQHKKSRYRAFKLKQIVNPAIIERITDIDDYQLEEDLY